MQLFTCCHKGTVVTEMFKAEKSATPPFRNYTAVQFCNCTGKLMVTKIWAPCHTGELKLYAQACSVKISAERYPQISCVCA